MGIGKAVKALISQNRPKTQWIAAEARGHRIIDRKQRTPLTGDFSKSSKVGDTKSCTPK